MLVATGISATSEVGPINLAYIINAYQLPKLSAKFNINGP